MNVPKMHSQHYSKEENEASASIYSLIFLDINMPGMNGWDFIDAYDHLSEEVRANNSVVMLTTSYNPDDKSRAEKNSNIYRFLSKPLTIEAVLDIISEAFVAQ